MSEVHVVAQVANVIALVEVIEAGADVNERDRFTERRAPNLRSVGVSRLPTAHGLLDRI